MHPMISTSSSIQRFLLLTAVLACSVMLPSCIVAALGAGVGAVAYGGAKQREAYATYRTGMERLNFDRERAGMYPTPILSYDEWIKGNR